MKKKFYIFFKVTAISASILLSTNGISQDYRMYAIIGDYLATIDYTTGNATQIVPLMDDSIDFSSLILTYEPNIDKLLAIADKLTEPKLISIDRVTGEVTEIGLVDLPSIDLKLIEAMGYNPDNGNLYAAGYEIPFGQGNWYFSRKLMTIDPLTGNATLVSDISGTCDNEADRFAFSSSGKYSMDGCPNPVRLYSIDLANGNSTSIGPIGSLSSPRLAAHPTTGELFAVEPDIMQLYSVSTVDATISSIGQILSSDDFDGGLVTAITFADYIVNTVEVEKEKIKSNYNYPNPFSSTTNIVFETNSSVDIQILVYDIFGKLVYDSHTFLALEGTNVKTINFNVLRSGVYVYEVRASDYSLYGKMISKD